VMMTAAAAMTQAESEIVVLVSLSRIVEPP
jgi:hypothetical protein